MKTYLKYRSKVHKGLLIAVLSLGTVACDEEFLDMAPITSLSSLTAFDTPDRILSQVYGLYGTAKSASLFGGRYIILQELRGDDFLMNKPNVVTGQLTWEQTVSSTASEVTGIWSQAYATVNRVNVFLVGLEENQDKISAALYKNYVGEAKLLRALSYLALVQQYARPFVEDNGASMGVPLRLKAEQGAANNDLARSTVAEVYTQILKDLNDAETGLPLNYSTAVLNSTRSHRNAAIALKSRVYLAMGQFGNVVSEANKIVSASYQAPSGVVNRLESNSQTVFTGSYTGPEVLLTFPWGGTNLPGGQSALAYYFTFNTGNAEFYLNTAPGTTASDPVFTTGSTDTRKGFVELQSGFYWMTKYKTKGSYSDYVPVVRYAEVLLNYAEAAAKTDDLPKALELLNVVRKRSDPTYVFPAESVATKDALINTILQERKIELLGEGFITVDLLRQLKPLPGKIAAAGVANAVPVSASNYVWPISSAELANNRLMVPNP